MILFYLLLGAFLLISGVIIILFPMLFKKLLNIMIEKELFYLMGIAEIAMGLGTLFFRHETKATWFALVAGLALFIDGVFYMISTGRVKESFQWFLSMEDKAVKIYGAFVLVVGGGFFLMSII